MVMRLQNPCELVKSTADCMIQETFTSSCSYVVIILSLAIALERIYDYISCPFSCHCKLPCFALLTLPIPVRRFFYPEFCFEVSPTHRYDGKGEFIFLLNKRISKKVCWAKCSLKQSWNSIFFINNSFKRESTFVS